MSGISIVAVPETYDTAKIVGFQLVYVKLLVESCANGTEVHGLRSSPGLGSSVSPIHHDPKFCGNVSNGHDSETFAWDLDNLPVQVFLATFQFAPVLKNDKIKDSGVIFSTNHENFDAYSNYLKSKLLNTGFI